MSDLTEKLAEHLYGHSREKAIEWAKEDKFDSCYRQAEDIIELLGIERLRAENATLREALRAHGEEVIKRHDVEPVAIPEGWQLVPKCPTEAMINAGATFQGTVVYGMPEVHNVYQDMLAASPQPK